MHTLRLKILATLLVLASGVVACEDGTFVDAPPVAQPQTSCPSLDQTIPLTLGAINDGQLFPVRELIRQVDASRKGRRVTALVDALIAILRAIPDNIIELVDTTILRGLITDAQPLLLTTLEPLAALDPAVPEQRDRLLVFDAANEFITTCPANSLTNAAQLLLSNPGLLENLRLALKDPFIIQSLETLYPLDGQPESRYGFALLIDTIINALLSNNFEFDAIVELLEPFLPVDQAPLSGLLNDLQQLLSGDGIATLATALECVDAVERTTSTGESLDSGKLIGLLLYDILATQRDDIAQLIALVEPLLQRASDPAVFGLIQVILDAIQGDNVLRTSLIDIFAFTLEIERTHLLLQSVYLLLEIGTLPELIDLVDAVILTPDCGDPEGALLGQLRNATVHHDRP